MAGAARAVRIPRRAEGSPVAERSLAAPATTEVARADSPRFKNSAGSARAYRTFFFFLAAVAAIYGLFIGLAARSAAGGANLSVEEFLTGAVAVALVVGWFVTLGQAPASAWVERGQLVVRERSGRFRRFPAHSLKLRVLRSNGTGPFGPEPTDFVEVSVPEGGRRTYLVGAHFFDFAQPAT